MVRGHSGTYKFYIGYCCDCDKSDIFPEYLYKNKQTAICQYCNEGTVYIDKTETYKGKK